MSNPTGKNQFTGKSAGQATARGERSKAKAIFGGNKARADRHMQHAAAIRHNAEFKSSVGMSSYPKAKAKRK